MRDAQPVERKIGIAWYASDADGIGGELKREAADFRVEELETIDPQPLDADPDAYPYLLVRATLAGWDTFGFVDRLAGEIGLHRGAIDWAGTKDKAAVTTQLFSIKGADASDLPDIDHATIEPIGRFGRGLTFGDLAGNAFDIRVRDARTVDRIDSITAELTAFGGGTLAVPNFFGQQRFGSRRPITHAVGFAIVAGNWEEAVLRYVGRPSEREPEETQAARAYVEETRDWAGGADRMPRGLGHERRILESLAGADPDDPDRFRLALEELPEQLRRLFVHAAQSAMFNRILSERRGRGLPFDEAVAGDRVCFASPHERLGNRPDPHRTQRVTPDRVGTVNRHVRNGRAFVTAPLVGTDTEIGSGEPGQIVQDVLDDEGLSPADFDLPEPYDSTGTVRPILVRPNLRIERDPLRFAFDLPSGSYATVVMREFLKVDPDAMS